MTGKSDFHPPCNQIAFSVVDLRSTERWFREGLGFLPAGGSRLMMSGPLAALVQGLPRAASTCWWLVGRNPWVQLELFQFRRPIARLMPCDARPCDIGYRRIGVWVADFDGALDRLAGLGSFPLGPILGARGQRRAAVRNPDGVFVEVLENDPLPQPADRSHRDCGVAVRSVTLSTPNLTESVALFAALTAASPAPVKLHRQEHEALWGLEDATLDSAVFICGDLLVELVQYANPVGKPWPQGYRLSDQGILNIAFGARNRSDHRTLVRRSRAHGARANFRPIDLPGAGVVYVTDRLGFSVELLWMSERSDRRWGFVPLPVRQRVTADNQLVEAAVEIAAPVDAVWSVINDHDRMGQWIGFDPVTRVRRGEIEPNGRGAERRMKGPTGWVIEQVTATVPNSSVHYRVINGSPFIFHLGEIRLEAAGARTRITWRIRFRSRVPLLGGLWRRVLHLMLSRMLVNGLKPFAERASTGDVRRSGTHALANHAEHGA